MSTDAVELPEGLLAELDHDPRKLRLLEWLCTIPKYRHPADRGELAVELGVTRRTIHNWQGKDTFQAVWRREASKIAGGIERTAELLDVLYETGKDREDKLHVVAANSFIKHTQSISPQDAPARLSNPFKDMSLEELERLYAEQLQKELQSRGVLAELPA